ncbi:hypothetical protein [Oceanisphaera sediminis]
MPIENTLRYIDALFVGPVLMALLVAIWREWLHSLIPDTQA